MRLVQMEKKALIKTLEGVEATRKSRLLAADWVLQQKERVPALLMVVFSGKEPQSKKACWVLDFVVEKDIRALNPYLETFVDGLAMIKDPSAQRPMARISENLLKAYDSNPLQTDDLWSRAALDKMTGLAFDWLLNSDKPAIQAHAMSVLYYLGKVFQWIPGELETLLRQRYYNESAAFRARARMILKLIKRDRRKA